MTDEKHEPAANLSLRVTVPLLAKLLIENPDVTAELSNNVVKAAMKKVNMQSINEEIERLIKTRFNQFARQVENAIAENIGAKITNGRYNRPSKWEISDALRDRIKSVAEFHFHETIRDAISVEAMKEQIGVIAASQVNYRVDEKLFATIDARIRRHFKAMGNAK